ncbi:GNAT family N-acetyltransferase [Paenibacillus sp. NFR01]|uniref:GNAT family N-acetyltransferase n=1 Tax=Paenibacillus sp. NFR01 TaxID=1566279 RepID=UPI0008CEBA38|nr:GNAT family N-acetyltransferase [Paenibacillus sp. NFR01]SET27267.1 hypothetical protein SAMN03159358_1197 [Paenibacillus sp. NFR01]
MINVFEECPSYKKTLINIRLIQLGDVQGLLQCYSDEQAVPLFNSDNCHGDDFHYETAERMKQAIDDWLYAYQHKYYVRWTVILNETQEILGTIEMVRRHAEDAFKHYGILRIDLKSTCEDPNVIDEILEIADEHLYELFDVNDILTKAIPQAAARIEALLGKGYRPLNQKMVIFDDYFVKSKPVTSPV